MSPRSMVLVLAVVVPLVAGCSPGSAESPVNATGTTGAGLSTGAPPSLASYPEPSHVIAAPPSPAASGAIDPASFTSTVDNALFPLVPGTTMTYEGTKDGRKAIETFTVTGTTKVIDRVSCVVVEDTISFGGVVAEKLLGYYAQDRDGNVWYFGEDDQELDPNGQVVGTAGSWRAGVDKAPPAMFMEASPTVGHTFAHDYTKTAFAVLSISEHVAVPFGTFANAVLTKEWSPLEPDVETHKYYVRDVGLVRDVAAKGPVEEFVLVKVEQH